MSLLFKNILQKIKEFEIFTKNFIIKKGDIIERNQNINFTKVDIKQYGKIVNIALELDCTNVSLVDGQILIGKISGVQKYYEWIRCPIAMGDSFFNYKSYGRIAINPQTGEIFIEDDKKSNAKFLYFSYTYLVD